MTVNDGGLKGLTKDQAPIKVSLTVDVEWDYARSESHSILEQTAPFFQWLREEQIPLTAFVTGHLLKQGHAVIDSLQAAGVPIGVHGFEHKTEDFGTMNTRHEDEIRQGMDAYMKRIGHLPAGYRAPSGIVSREDILLLNKLGLRYDASVFPLRRPHRYNFSGLPRIPFQWEGTSLVEMPFGLVTNSLPAGMTFINLLGATLSSSLLRKQARSLAGSAAVVDMHFHNLFTHYPAMQSLPLGLRMIYLAGAWADGFSCLKSLVLKLRRVGAIFSSLEADALSLNAEALPVVGFDSFARGS